MPKNIYKRPDMYENYKDLLITRTGKILTVALNAPERLNAINASMHEELSRIFYDVDADRDTEVVILTGSGRAFCAGGDIKDMQAWYEEPALFDAMAREARKIIFGMLECDKPILCKMNGAAYGLGATLALFCDLIFADERAKIADPHVSVGLSAGDGGVIIWPQLIGFARAKEFLMTGDSITAVRAAEIGLINRALPGTELEAYVQEFAQRLANGASQSIRYTKRSINIALKQLAHSIMDASMAYESLSNRSFDHAEAIAAYVEKRRPLFNGT
jgi:enoyl-CoA hydratase